MNGENGRFKVIAHYLELKSTKTFPVAVQSRTHGMGNHVYNEDYNQQTTYTSQSRIEPYMLPSNTIQYNKIQHWRD